MSANLKKTIQARLLSNGLIECTVYEQEFALDQKDASLLLKEISEACLQTPLAGQIPTTIETKPDPSTPYLEAVLQAQGAHLADTRAILQLVLNQLFPSQPVQQPVQPVQPEKRMLVCCPQCKLVFDGKSNRLNSEERPVQPAPTTPGENNV